MIHRQKKRWRALEPHVRGFSDERRVAVVLYREWAKGGPVDEAQLGRSLDLCTEGVRKLLNRDTLKHFIHSDREGRIIGFGGLATVPMHHRFQVAGRDLLTWCAWDSLFIPEILGARRFARSRGSRTGASGRDAGAD